MTLSATTLFLFPFKIKELLLCLERLSQSGFRSSALQHVFSLIKVATLKVCLFNSFAVFTTCKNAAQSVQMYHNGLWTIGSSISPQNVGENGNS